MAADEFTHNGKHIDSMKLQVRGLSGLPCQNSKGEDMPLQIDDVVNMHVEGRVTGSRFAVNDKTGELEQTFTIKPLDVGFQPWDPSDPSDDGVSRWNTRLGQVTTTQANPQP